MTTFLYTDPRFLEHRPAGQHPECPERIKTLHYKLLDKSTQSKALVIKPAVTINSKLLSAVHDPHVLSVIESKIKQPYEMIDGDTYVCPRSDEIARLAAGSAVAAVDAVVGQQAQNALCIIRPPGHHATRNRSMGFCLYNNIAVAAQHAINQHKLSRVLIIDWDVHHGNGTQDIFYANDQVYFLSMHRYPFYPGTGAASETGTGRGLGYTLNLPIKFGTPTKDIITEFRRGLTTALSKFKPELVLISAGFDAHRLDPIGDLGFDFPDFQTLAQEVIALAQAESKRRIVVLLEGGYNISALEQCVLDLTDQLVGSNEP